VSTRALRRHLGSEVIVNVAEGDERAFRGTLAGVTSEHLTLRDAQVVSPRGAPLGGLAVIPLMNVTWVQVM